MPDRKKSEARRGADKGLADEFNEAEQCSGSNNMRIQKKMQWKRRKHLEEVEEKPMATGSRTLYFHHCGPLFKYKPLEPSICLPSYPLLWCYPPLPQPPISHLPTTFPLSSEMPAPW